ncbi:hypothetical protein [Variovorax sp. Varisp62]|uniref:hypothetical protein n=1 Tax=Variovorax sp. Varisp62 TaxID=3243049 RepID=UPI002F0DAC74
MLPKTISSGIGVHAATVAILTTATLNGDSPPYAALEGGAFALSAVLIFATAALLRQSFAPPRQQPANNRRGASRGAGDLHRIKLQQHFIEPALNISHVLDASCVLQWRAQCDPRGAVSQEPFSCKFPQGFR